MAGIIYPGINRLDYDFHYEGGYFPVHVESNTDPQLARWLEDHIYMVPVTPRPFGYDPLVTQNLDPEWIRRLGQTGKDCFDAILAGDAAALGCSMNDCMVCWEAILLTRYTIPRSASISWRSLDTIRNAIMAPCIRAAAVDISTSCQMSPFQADSR